LIAIADVVETETAKSVAAAAGCPFFTDDRSLLELQPDLVVEAASQDAVRLWAGEVLESGADLLVVSVGALAAPDVLGRLTDLARRHGRRIHVPSGAIGGIDVIKGAAVGGIEECRLTTTKPPKALAGAPYVREHRIDLDGIDKATLIYEGPASQAVRHFPQNVNVAATIGLAGIGMDRTIVRIVADPAAAHNVHEVFIRGTFGEATIRLANLPSPVNPKTSYLTSLSVIAALQSLSREFQLGT
jgi:aspartate dehydrogenase